MVWLSLIRIRGRLLLLRMEHSMKVMLSTRWILTLMLFAVCDDCAYTWGGNFLRGTGA